MHCGICRQPGHKRTTCPTLKVQIENVKENVNDMQGTGNEGQHDEDEEQYFDYNGDAEDAYYTSEQQFQKEAETRPKLPIRRKGLPGIVIKEPTNATSTGSVKEKLCTEALKGKHVVKETVKGKEKVGHKSQTNRLERPFWMQKNKKVTENDGSKKFITFAEHKEGGNHEAPLKPFDAFEARLIGPLGFGNIFMPTPGFLSRNHQPNGTPSAGTPPVQKVSTVQSSQPNEDLAKDDESVEDDESIEDEDLAEDEGQAGRAPTRRSTRLIMKTSFKFSNTPDTALDLDED